ncbi:MAG: hypothetical protein JW904_00755 [Spirochaetales bacterium]|nr:hypothetical protein [Spirochaetales bacterium]
MKRYTMARFVSFLLIATVAGFLMSCDFMFSSELVYEVNEDGTADPPVMDITYTDFFGVDKTVTVDFSAPLGSSWRCSIQVFRGRTYRLSIAANNGGYWIRIYKDGDIVAAGDHLTPASFHID